MDTKEILNRIEKLRHKIQQEEDLLNCYTITRKELNKLSLDLKDTIIKK